MLRVPVRVFPSLLKAKPGLGVNLEAQASLCEMKEKIPCTNTNVHGFQTYTPKIKLADKSNRLAMMTPSPIRRATPLKLFQNTTLFSKINRPFPKKLVSFPVT
jgi:hypothetical protein